MYLLTCLFIYKFIYLFIHWVVVISLHESVYSITRSFRQQIFCKQIRTDISLFFILLLRYYC
jgi:hypothetical protein